MKSELSRKNPYYISKHRYQELRHFCLQYDEWAHEYAELDTTLRGMHISSKSISASDPTERLVEKRLYFKERMELVEKAAAKTDSVLSGYILKGVTKGLSYDFMRARMDIPCCRENYYDAYRRFFYILSELRN